MRIAVSFAFLVLASAASAATVGTPAGKVDIPQPSDQYVGHGAAPADADVSWGKTGISYDQYQYDAHYCAATGVLLALKAPAWALNKGGTDSFTDAVERRWQNPQLTAFGESNLEHCLAVRGYSKFRLTPEQTSHLQALAHGSVERHHYLYSLSSDAEILARQKF